MIESPKRVTTGFLSIPSVLAWSLAVDPLLTSRNLSPLLSAPSTFEHWYWYWRIGMILCSKQVLKIVFALNRLSKLSEHSSVDPFWSICPPQARKNRIPTDNRISSSSRSTKSVTVLALELRHVHASQIVSQIFELPHQIRKY